MEYVDESSPSPSTFCLGNVGAVKSAVLNSLIGHPVLATSENGATRAPISIDLQRDGSLSTKSIVLQIDDKSATPPLKLVDLPEILEPLRLHGGGNLNKDGENRKDGKRKTEKKKHVADSPPKSLKSTSSSAIRDDFLIAFNERMAKWKQLIDTAVELTSLPTKCEELDIKMKEVANLLKFDKALDLKASKQAVEWKIEKRWNSLTNAAKEFHVNDQEMEELLQKKVADAKDNAGKLEQMTAFLSGKRDTVLANANKAYSSDFAHFYSKEEELVLTNCASEVELELCSAILEDLFAEVDVLVQNDSTERDQLWDKMYVLQDELEELYRRVKEKQAEVSATILSIQKIDERMDIHVRTQIKFDERIKHCQRSQLISKKAIDNIIAMKESAKTTLDGSKETSSKVDKFVSYSLGKEEETSKLLDAWNNIRAKFLECKQVCVDLQALYVRRSKLKQLKQYHDALVADDFETLKVLVKTLGQLTKVTDSKPEEAKSKLEEVDENIAKTVLKMEILKTSILDYKKEADGLISSSTFDFTDMLGSLT